MPRHQILFVYVLSPSYSMAGGEFKQLFRQPDDVSIVLENTDFAVLAKPPGIETVSGDGAADLTGLARHALGDPALTPAHRLDRDTSGAQLFARGALAERELTALFRRREVDKTYIAVCLGRPRNASGTINRNLSEWSGGRRPVRVLKQGGLEATTSYRVLAASNRLPDGLAASLVAFFPHQGRTHQIRVHAAALGYPILGDDQYGDRPANRLAATTFGLRRQALHSWRLGFAWKGGKIAAVCPLHNDLLAAAAAIARENPAGTPPGVFPPDHV